MKLKNLVGYELINLNKLGMLIKKDNDYYNVYFHVEEHGCSRCEIYTEFLDTGISRPKITKILQKREPFVPNTDGYKITLFENDSQIGNIEMSVSSEDGDEYGSFIAAKCYDLDLCETIVSW